MKKLFVLFLTLLVVGAFVLWQNEHVLMAIDGEENSGGIASSNDFTENAFSMPLDSLTSDQRLQFELGNSFFTNAWVEAPATATARDGLGPFFNAESCAACHIKDGRGKPPQSSKEKAVGLLFRLSIPGETANGSPKDDPNYGGQLNPFALDSLKGEASVDIRYETLTGKYDDGQPYTLRKPIYSFNEPNYGPFSKELMVSPRIAPANFGLGLLEAIPENAILALADPLDANGDSISGRPNFVYDARSGKKKLGRFGWKANQPSIEQQVAGAFLGDMGITSSMFIDENVTAAEAKALALPNGGSPETSDEILKSVVFYAQTLAVPKRRNWADPAVLQGKEIFQKMNCVACHVPAFNTGIFEGVPALSNQKIYPYTDLLLHDMGEELADHRPDFEANGNEWRTQPLWGVGLQKKVNRHTFFLHDGRARSLTEAILWHGGEAETTKNKFKALTAEERQKVISFLESL